MNLLEFRSYAQGSDWTEAFRAAIEALSRTGGGTLEVPSGEYLTHSIRLVSNLTLCIANGAVIRFFPNPSEYAIDQFEVEGEVRPSVAPLIFADGARFVRITGDGVIDGCGQQWWQAAKSGQLAAARPSLLCFRGCEHVVLEGITLINSPFWTVHPLRCSDVVIREITIKNPKDAPNTDGINPNGSRNVRISDCLIDVGDDCIAIKSGTEETENPLPCENIIISGCVLQNGHGGVVIGSEMSGGVRNVVVTGCVFQGTDRGIRIKTRRGRGGLIENLTFSHISMDGVQTPFVVNMYYFCGKGGKEASVADKSALPVTASTPAISNIRLHDITAINATVCAGFVYGLPEMPVERLSLTDYNVTMKPGTPGRAAMMDGAPEMEAAGFFIRNAREIELSGVRVYGAIGESIDRDSSVS